MLEFLAESQCIGRACFHAKSAECAHRQVIDVLVNDPYLLPFGTIHADGDDLDGTIRTVGFTDAATGTAMLVVGIMGHDDLPFEPFFHFELFPVLGILLGYNLSWMDEIIAGYHEAFPE